MFRCFDSLAGEDVIIVDAEGDFSRMDMLRSKGRRGELVCPECRQPVLVRAGERKSPHFAHKSLLDCPLSSESAEVLRARRVLYRWLCSKYPECESGSDEKGDEVGIEARLNNELDRPVDCLLTTKEGKRFAYWILERGMRDRYEVARRLTQTDVLKEFRERKEAEKERISELAVPQAVWRSQARRAKPPIEEPSRVQKPLRCSECGELTTDWLSADLGEGTCVCTRCSRRAT